MSPNYNYEEQKRQSDAFRAELMPPQEQSELAPVTGYAAALDALLEWLDTEKDKERRLAISMGKGNSVIRREACYHNGRATALEDVETRLLTIKAQRHSVEASHG